MAATPNGFRKNQPLGGMIHLILVKFRLKIDLKQLKVTLVDLDQGLRVLNQSQDKDQSAEVSIGLSITIGGNLMLTFKIPLL